MYTQFVFKIHPPNVEFSDYPLAHFISIIFTKTILVFARIEKFCNSYLSLPISYVSFKSQTTFFFLRKDFTDLPTNINSLLETLQSIKLIAKFHKKLFHHLFKVCF